MNSTQQANDQKFRAIVVTEEKNGSFSVNVQTRNISDLITHDVLIRVLFSGINYKDALSASGHKGITRRFPHTPGIDAAGIVVESANQQFQPGDEVIVTGYDLGMNTSGGFAEYIRVPAGWVVKKPEGLSLEECMIIGTSGFTAASAIFEIMKHGIRPEDGKILVTGASGAVGSMAVAMLATAGYNVLASSGKPEAETILRQIGASEITGREAIDDKSGKGLLPARWIAALDTVGGNTLATVLLSTAERGLVANCGMLASDKLEVPVFPFIIRGVRLVGIASADTPMSRRLEIWKLIADKLKSEHLHSLAQTISLDEIPEALIRMKASENIGKILVRMAV
ncbi:MAG: quinone oxidoreductase YhdH/YhfP [Bacteroidetes bacterium]|nr:MAG: quinone oxidoreductase YhdH/YhfP [Bacteroidota bacterium]